MNDTTRPLYVELAEKRDRCHRAGDNTMRRAANVSDSDSLEQLARVAVGWYERADEWDRQINRALIDTLGGSR